MNRRNRWKFCSAEFKESLENLENPARGWYGIYTFPVWKHIDPGELRWSLREGESLALVLIDIQKYRSMLLDEDALQNIRDILSFFMQYEKDVILRPVYDREGNGYASDPDTFKIVLQHQIQIGELLKNMKHSVIIFQGMLVGSWGEMHNSRYLSAEYMHQMWNCLRQYMKDEQYLAVRTPAQWRTLKTEEQFLKKEYTGLSLFDDGILGSLTHLGTFGTMTRDASGWSGRWTRKEELGFIDRLTEDVPCGGEVTLNTEEQNEEFFKEDFIVSELKKMHLTYLNSTYDMRVLEQWKEMRYTGRGIWKGSRLYDYIGSHLGYRFVVKSVGMKINWKRNVEITIEIENVGFGRIYQETELILLIDNGRNKKEISVSMELEKIYPGISLKGKAVTDPVQGKVFLKARRKSDGRAIYFANENSEECFYIGCLC